jgi:threonine dehydrogenase-like Zn-dependent dehydrogenase
VPCADFGAFKVPESLTDEQVLFLTDIFPTGFMAAENCGIEPGQTVAVWGCGPVGQFAIRSAFLLGAGRVIALDNIPERLELARKSGAETLNDEDKDVQEKLRAMTSGRGPDHCIDAVGMEAHGATLDALYDRIKTAVMLETDRSHALRAAIFACAKGGTVSIPESMAASSTSFHWAARSQKASRSRWGRRTSTGIYRGFWILSLRVRSIRVS